MTETHRLTRHYDERGTFTELLRTDWKNILNEPINQINLSCSYPGIIRAWHRHQRGQNDYFICIQGTIKVCTYDDREDSPSNGELREIILTGEQPTIYRVPGILWHGYKVISSKPIKLLYGVNKLYDYDNPDEERRPWNDPKIIPTSINGKTDDPRVGKSYDWNYPPHK
jgi:dTDP-4-dehydrorhamnose 3,5-epimerase